MPLEFSCCPRPATLCRAELSGADIGSSPTPSFLSGSLKSALRRVAWKASRAITPSAKPNQSVQKRISNVAAPPNAAEGETSKRVSPNTLPSAAPSPPGRPEADPTSDEKARMKVALISKSGLGAIPSPVKTKYKAAHSPDHEIRPMRIASSKGRQRNKV